MKRQRGDSELWGSIILLIIMGVGAMIWMAVSCYAKWGDIAKEVSWGPFQGCMLTLRDGRRVPAEAVRDIDVIKEQK